MTHNLDSTILRLKPFVIGHARQNQVIARLVSEPRYLDLTMAELNVLERLATLDLSIDGYLKWHLAGRDGLSFYEAVQLLFRLQDAGFLADGTEGIVEKKLRDLQGQSEPDSTRFFKALSRSIAAIMNINLLEMDHIRVGRMFHQMGSLALRNEGMFFLAGLVAILVTRTPVTILECIRMFRLFLSQPESALIQFSIGMSAVSATVSLLQLSLLSALNARFIRSSVSVTFLSFVRFNVQDEDSLLFSKPTLIRYGASVLLAPWILGLVLWNVSSQTDFTYARMIALSCFAYGIGTACPLFHTQLIRIAESWTGTLDFLGWARNYLRRRLFSGLGAKDKDGRLFVPNQIADAGATILAAYGLLWLYTVSSVGLDTLIATVPSLIASMQVHGISARGIAATLAISALSLTLLIAVGTLLSIVGINLSPLWRWPLAQLSRVFHALRSKHSGGREVEKAFLREHPLFSDVPESQIAKTAEQARIQAFRRGECLVRQGDSGDTFYLLSQGTAHVVREEPSGKESLLAELGEGDSFGEIALVEKSPRNATVRATSHGKALVLSRGDFDMLFPQSSPIRLRLTSMLRQIKLMTEAPALSHFSPGQTRAFIRLAKVVDFRTGELIVTEGESSSSVFLIETGTAEVSREGQTLANVSRGELVGATGVLKGTRRSANVIAKTDVRCLKVERDDFLKLCLSNIHVALLVSAIADRQAAENLLKAGDFKTSDAQKAA